ncbi:hypothetical protein SJI45_22895 [Streptomyces sp. S399]|uniref:hypothetical protein n=1 Tax=Streptomyces sp. S399 TaxID=3096009 RepID=UPI002A83C010|nr:hypothetical protein [Streptomyces sp. S399]WPR53476.1 hypothetical protein SJI45_22895 [Streptomyces sp. S399]
MTTTPAPRTTANPRRTTLARLTDAAALGRPPGAPTPHPARRHGQPAPHPAGDHPAVTGPTYGAKLPGQTANPVRTILMTAPAPAAPRPVAAAAE